MPPTPTFPPSVAASWRREVKTAKRADDDGAALRRARAGVQAAKVALRERGTPWWEQSDAERRARWETDVPTPDPRRRRLILPTSRARSRHGP